MQSIRFRLAVYYSLALTATMVAFGAAVYWERTATAPREAELRLDAHAQERERLRGARADRSRRWHCRRSKPAPHRQRPGA